MSVWFVCKGCSIVIEIVSAVIIFNGSFGRVSKFDRCSSCRCRSRSRCGICVCSELLEFSTTAAGVAEAEASLYFGAVPLDLFCFWRLFFDLLLLFLEDGVLELLELKLFRDVMVLWELMMVCFVCLILCRRYREMRIFRSERRR